MSRTEYNIEKKDKNQRRREGPPGMRPMGDDEKAKDFKKAIAQLLIYCKKYLAVIIASVILSATGTVFNVIGPDKLSEMTDIITKGLLTKIDFDAFIKVAVFLAVLYGLGMVFNFVQGLMMAAVTQRVSKRLRADISTKINRIPLKYFDTNSYGDILSRVTNDVDTIAQSLNQSFSMLISALVSLIGALIMMFHTNWILTLSAIGSSVIGFGLMMVIIGRSQKYFMEQQDELGNINGHIEEIYAGHNIVKVYNGDKPAIETFREINDRLYNNAWKSQFLSGLMMPLMGFIGNLGYVTVCVVGAVLALNGTITFGVIVAFMIYVRLFTQPLSQLAQAAASLQSTAAASERVFEFLGEKELENESHKTKRLESVKGDVEFKNVRFAYDEGKPVIKGFSASIKAGQKIAIVGPTGAGKTTMVNLLMRFYELDSGEITIDGVSTNTLTRENVHDMFCMVLQDTWLFEGTIKENIIYSKQNISDEQVEEACRAVGLHNFIKSLPEGYDTVLNDNANLSAGEKQLVTIARAVVENAPLLILDEATSSVDTRTELLIQQAMDSLTAGKTSFVIAHRLSTIKNADLILVIMDGDIVESGNHSELLAKGGFYAELYNSQFATVSSS